MFCCKIFKRMIYERISHGLLLIEYTYNLHYLRISNAKPGQFLTPPKSCRLHRTSIFLNKVNS